MSNKSHPQPELLAAPPPRKPVAVQTTAPSLATLAEHATLALSSELLALRERAQAGGLDPEDSDRLTRAIRAMCALAKERRETLADQRANGQALATEDALRELLDNPDFRGLLMRLLAERKAQGLSI